MIVETLIGLAIILAALGLLVWIVTSFDSFIVAVALVLLVFVAYYLGHEIRGAA